MEGLTASLLRIHGNVQGVGYRESMRREAVRLGVTGWVRNRRDGTVEALVCGTTAQTAALIEWARRGPRFAAVSKVDVAEAEPPASDSFEIAPSL